MLVGLSPRHSAIVKHKEGSDTIAEIRFDSAKTAQISGKNKKGAQNMSMQSIICEVGMVSGKVYKIRSFAKNAKMIEFNERLLSANNIDLLVSRPEEEGYLAILMLPIVGGTSPDNSALLASHIHEGDQLVSQTDYFNDASDGTVPKQQ